MTDQRTHWTPAETIARMDAIEADMDGILDALQAADLDWVTLKAAADLAEDSEYLKAEGSIEYRNRWARTQTINARLAEMTAAAVVRNLRSRLRILESKADTARSRNAAIRADVGLTSSGRGRP
jgi:hypothetical protein